MSVFSLINIHYLLFGGNLISCTIVFLLFRLSKVFEDLLQKWVLSSDRPENPDIKQ